VYSPSDFSEFFVAGATGSGSSGPGPSVGPYSYVHNQGTTSATWSILHNLGWYPNVTIIDSAGTTVEGDVSHISQNLVSITFSGAFTGVAYLS
jgi:hypothetical protein